ncbi:hypothetical protein FGG08_006251 [Glutinoglossum americanum]|uniref:Uncharacterized protein n=1 Tax=Glutinoglossum americanum TaxID=1670608 RepID=A0A9P8KXN7_9PEZI|nr:hypothetical protein FGG08_006251 [Glutinoglossum americanum]
MADRPASPPSLRMSSPSPSTSPTPAIFSCPPLERSVSTASTTSSVSGRSSMSRSSDVAARRRGYVRPQATEFSKSARQRQSVMSLGSIAHLQYYFARTGLLDGKGGQLHSGKPLFKNKKRHASSTLPPLETSFDSMHLAPLAGSDRRDSTYSSSRSTPEPLLDSAAGGMVESPIEEEDEEFGADYEDQEPMMLPPTVSTYNYRTEEVAPPPDVETLRRELRECLEDSKKVLNETDRDREKDQLFLDSTDKSLPPPSSNQGWHEMQGMHLLDILTLAIRAMKVYSTAHEQPARLSAIKSERKIREELLAALEVLKRMAGRKFAGGMRQEESDAMRNWVSSVEALMLEEERREQLEQQKRAGWKWIRGDWTGREHEREWLFLQSFDDDPSALPRWDESSTAFPTPFLKTLQSGLRLVNLHNVLVKASKRPFGGIPVFHTDTAKPYRAAENLRFWIKAAEIRWEVRLKVDVMDVVHGENEDAWRGFEDAIGVWTMAIREEFVKEWSENGEEPRMAGAEKDS